jgi:ABC-type nitrate/sulfonate/bicarbonate transport system permease component
MVEEVAMTMAIPDTQCRPRKSSAANLKLLSAMSVVAVLGIWSAASLAGWLSSGVCPPPWEILKSGYRLVTVGFAGSTLQVHLLSSFGRFAAGFLLAAIIGVPLGLVMGWSAPIRYVVTPFFETFRFIAPLAWIPFAALWFGTRIGGPILIVFSGAFAPCVINAFRGAQQVDPVLLEASRTLGASPWRLTVDVLLPGALPSIMAGLRVSAALAWQSLVGAELIVASSGVGYMMVQGQGSFETSIVLAGMGSIGIVGLIIDKILQLASDRIGSKWRQTAP